MNQNEIFEGIGDAELFAITIYGEARGEDIEGKKAVAAVIANRIKRGGWFGRTLKEVVLKPWQFSTFNIGDPNRVKLEEIAGDFTKCLDTVSSLKECYWVALGALAGWLGSNVGDATHYFADYIEPPDWAEKLEHITDIGRHKFFLE